VESLVIIINELGFINLSSFVIVIVVDASESFQFLRLIISLVLLKSSIHSGSPEEGAYIISLITISLKLFPGAETVNCLINSLLLGIWSSA